MHHGRTVVPPTKFTVQIEVQGTPLEKVVDTGAEVTVLGTEVHDRLEEKPPVRRLVTMLQARDGALLKGFIAGPFDVKAGQNVHQVDLYVAHLKDSMLLGINGFPMGQQSKIGPGCRDPMLGE